MKGAGIVDRKHPAGGGVIAFPLGADIRENLEAVVDFYDVFIYERAYQLIGMVGGDQRVETVAAADVQGKHVVGRGTHSQILSFSRLRDHICRKIGSRQRTAGSENHDKHEQKCQKLFWLFQRSHSFPPSIMPATMLPRT